MANKQTTSKTNLKGVSGGGNPLAPSKMPHDDALTNPNKTKPTSPGVLMPGTKKGLGKGGSSSADNLV